MMWGEMCGRVGDSYKISLWLSQPYMGQQHCGEI